MKKRKIGIAIAIALPTLVTLLYFKLLEGHWLQKPAFALKVLQFAFPLAWVVWILKDAGVANRDLLQGTPTTTAQPWSPRKSVIFGVVMGVAVSLAMWLIYKSLPQSSLDGLIEKASGKVNQMGLASPALFIGLGVFYALAHSFLEEYYFRWFVFGQLRHVTKLWPSIAICGLAFMAHHVIILEEYFSWPIAIFLSLSIAVGGMIWAWQYEKSRSLLGPWISHMIVDAGIFYIGFDLLRSAGVI